MTTIEIDSENFDYLIFETETGFTLLINRNLSSENKINLKNTLNLIHGAVMLKLGYC
jgi:hypothetical protein